LRSTALTLRHKVGTAVGYRNFNCRNLSRSLSGAAPTDPRQFGMGPKMITSASRTRTWAATLTILATLFVCSTLTSNAQETDTRINDQKLAALVKLLTPKPISDPLIAPIDDALERRDFSRAESLCDELIEKPIAEFSTPYYGFRVKASAHYFKYHLALQSGQPEAAFDSQVAAIKNGSLDALNEFSENFLLRDRQTQMGARRLSAADLEEVFRTGADFGDPFATAAIGLLGVIPSVSPEERSYLTLLTIVRDKAKSLAERSKLFDSNVAAIGQERAERIVERFSSVGGILVQSSIGLPARALFETMGVDGDLRGTNGLARATNVPPGQKPEQSMTIREGFDVYSRLIPENRGGEAYLLVPGAMSSTASRIITAGTEKIISELQPGDRVFVTCGAFSHVAVLYRRDRVSQKLLFTDPLYEFWIPGINSCVSSFLLVEDKHKRFLSAVSESDVSAMLQAVLTARNAK
jgi:hypothetical protein